MDQLSLLLQKQIVVEWKDYLTHYSYQQSEVIEYYWQQLLIELQLPAWNTVVEATATAYRDIWNACSSIWHLLFLLGQPIVLLLRLILTPLLRHGIAFLRNVGTLLQHYVIPWILKHGGAQLRYLALQVYHFHLRRTPQELALEAGFFVTLWLLWKLYQHVKTQKWVTRSQAFVQRQGRRIAQRYRRHLRQVLDAYQRLVARIASVSQAFAVALPHCLYWSCAVFWTMTSQSDSLGATVLQYLATQTPLIALLQVGYPLLETMSCILQSSEIKELIRSRQPNDTDNNNNNKNHPDDDKSTLSGLQRRLHTLLDYWILYAAWQLAGAVLSSIPVLSYYLVNLPRLQVAHLWLAIWVACILYLTLTLQKKKKELQSSQANRTAITATTTPSTSATFLHWPACWILDHVVGGSSHCLHGIVSVEAWQRLLSLISPFLSLAEMMRLLSTPMRLKIVHALEELRVLVVPLFMCFVPFVSPWAVRYTEWIIPMSRYNSKNSSKSQHNNNEEEAMRLLVLAAQYWVLHLSLLGLAKFFGLSQLLPFNLLRFLGWWYLSWPTSIVWLWEWSGRELNLVVDILLGDAKPTDSSLVRAIHAIVDRLPKATITIMDPRDALNNNPVDNARSDRSQQQQQPPVDYVIVQDNDDVDDDMADVLDMAQEDPLATTSSTAARVPEQEEPQIDMENDQDGGLSLDQQSDVNNGDNDADTEMNLDSDEQRDVNNGDIEAEADTNANGDAHGTSNTAVVTDTAGADEMGVEEHLPSHHEEENELDENAPPSTINQTPSAPTSGPQQQQEKPLRRSQRNKKGKKRT